MKVLCIDDKIRPGELKGPMPVVGEVYTVMDEWVSYWRNPNGCLCYLLEELAPNIPPFGICGYNADRFIKAENPTDENTTENEHTELVPVALPL